MAAEEIDIKLLIETAESANSVSEVRKSIKDLKSAMNEVGTGSKEFTKLASAAGELKEKMDLTNKSVAALASSGAKFGAIAGLGKQVASGFEGAAAASALFGEKAEDAEKALLKAQAAASLTRAIGEFAEFGKVGALAANTIKAAFAANPVGAILIALTAIAAIGATIYENYFSATAQAKEELEVAHELTKAAEDNLEAVEGSTEQLKLSGKSEKEILKIKEEAVDLAIQASEEEISKQQILIKSQIETSKRNKEILSGILKFIEAPITVLLKTIDMVGKALGKDFNLVGKFSDGIAGLVFNPEKAEEEGKKTLEELDKGLKKLKEKRASFKNQENAIDKKDAEKAKKDYEQRIKDGLQELTKAEENKTLLTQVNSQERVDQESASMDAILAYSKKNALALGLNSTDLTNLELKNSDKKKQNEEGYQKYLKDIDDKRIAEQKRMSDAAFQAEQEELKAKLKKDEAILKTDKLNEDRFGQSIKDRLAAIKASNDAEIQIILDKANQEKIILEKAAADRIIAAGNDQQAIEDINNKLEQDKADVDKTTEEEITAQNDDENKRRLEAFKKSVDDRLGIATSLTNSLQGLSDAVFDIENENGKKTDEEKLKRAKNQFKINKGLQIASATIAGIQGVLNILSAPSVVPAPFGQILQAAEAVAFGVGAAANIAKISATQFSETGSGGGGAAASVPTRSSSVPSISAASTSAASTGGSNFQPSNMFGLGQGATQYNQRSGQTTVQVSVHDINKAQNKVAVINSRGTLK